MKHFNIEIKACCGEQERVREVLHAQGADFKGTDQQTDTYFRTNSGHLKLREGNIENFLVFYDRKDKQGPKQSSVMLLRAEPNSPLKEMLAKAFGTLVVVNKRREIYFIGNVKFHLDLVDGLGAFVEIEAIDADGSIGRDKLLEQCNEYVALLGIKASDLVSCSYSDLLLARTMLDDLGLETSAIARAARLGP